MDLTAWIAITKYYRLGGLNNRNIFFHSSGVQNAKIKMLSGLISGEASPANLQMETFLPVPYMTSSVCVRVHGEREREISVDFLL